MRTMKNKKMTIGKRKNKRNRDKIIRMQTSMKMITYSNQEMFFLEEFKLECAEFFIITL